MKPLRDRAEDFLMKAAMEKWSWDEWVQRTEELIKEQDKRTRNACAGAVSVKSDADNYIFEGGEMKKKYKSILNRLEQRCVFSVERNRKGTFNVQEECDMHYFETLTAEELIQLGNELIELAKQ